MKIANSPEKVLKCRFWPPRISFSSLLASKTLSGGNKIRAFHVNVCLDVRILFLWWDSGRGGGGRWGGRAAGGAFAIFVLCFSHFCVRSMVDHFPYCTKQNCLVYRSLSVNIYSWPMKTYIFMNNSWAKELERMDMRHLWTSAEWASNPKAHRELSLPNPVQQ